MANFTTEVNSIMGIAGTTAGTMTITLKITPNEGYLLAAEDFSVPAATNTNFENIAKGTVQEDGTLSFTMDLLDTINFGDASSYDIDLEGNARPEIVDVVANISFINDDCVNFSLRNANGYFINSKTLPISVSGTHEAGAFDEETSTIIHAGEVQINPAPGQMFTSTTLANNILPTNADGTTLFVLYDGTKNEHGGDTYSVGVVIPPNHTTISDHSIIGIEIGFSCGDDTSREECELLSIDVDTDIMSTENGGSATVVATGFEGAGGLLSLTPTLLAPPDYTLPESLIMPISKEVDISIGSSGKQAQSIFLEGFSGQDSNGNACEPDVPSDVGITWGSSFTPTSSTYFASGGIAADESDTIRLDTTTFSKPIIPEPGDSFTLNDEKHTVQSYTDSTGDVVFTPVLNGEFLGGNLNFDYDLCKFVGEMPDDIVNSEGTTVCFRVATGSTFLGGYTSTEEFVSDQGTITTYNLQGDPDIIEIRFGDDNVALGSGFSVSGNVVTFSTGLDSNAKTITFDYSYYSEETVSGFDDVLIGPGQPKTSFNSSENTHVFIAPAGSPWSILGTDGNPITVDSGGIAVTTTNDISYRIPNINSSVIITEGTSTGTELCDGLIRRTNNGLTLTVTYGYTSGSYQNENTKYLINLDTLAEELANTGVHLNFVNGLNYNFLPSNVFYSGTASSAIPSDGGFIPTSAILSTEAGYTWNTAGVELPSILTQLTEGDFVESPDVDVIDAVSLSLIDGTPLTAELLASTTNITSVVVRWTFTGNFPATGNIDITVNPSLTPTKLVTTSFDTGANNQGQATLVNSRFIPIQSVSGIAGREYTVPVIINSDDDHVFNQNSFPFIEVHNSTTADASVGSTSTYGDGTIVNEIERSTSLRATISGVHGDEDETVFIDANGKGLRIVDVQYTLSNNNSNVVVRDFIGTVQAVEGDDPLSRSLLIEAADDFVLTSQTTPTVTVNGVAISTVFNQLDSFGSDTFAQPLTGTGTHAGFVDFVDASGDSLDRIPGFDHRIHVDIDGISPVQLPITRNVCLDLTGLQWINPSSVQVEANGQSYLNSNGDISYTGSIGDSIDLNLSVDHASGYTFNNPENIELTYPTGVQQIGSPSIDSNGRWTTVIRLTVLASGSSNSCILADSFTVAAEPDVSLNVYLEGTTTNPPTPITLPSTANSSIGLDVVYDGNSALPAGWTAFTDKPESFFIVPTTGADGTTSVAIGTKLANTSPTEQITGTITFASNAAGSNQTRTISVVQEAADVFLTLTPSTRAIDEGGGSVNYTVGSNRTWDVYNLSDGFSHSISNNVITITAPANSTASPLNGSFSVTTDATSGVPSITRVGTFTQGVGEREVVLTIVDDYDNGTATLVGSATMRGQIGSTVTRTINVSADNEYTVYEENVDGTPSITYTISGQAAGNVFASPISNSASTTISAIIQGNNQTATVTVGGAAASSDSSLFLQKPEIQVELGSEVSVTDTTATVEYRVISDGGDPLTFHQLWLSTPGSYNATTGPKYDLTKIVQEPDDDDYAYLLEGLLPDTTYAYLTIARNGQGEVYGTPIAQSFRTEAAPVPEPVYTATLSVEENFNNNDFVTTTGDGQTRTGREGESWSFTTTVAPISSQHDILGNPTFSSSHGTPEGTGRSREIKGTFGNSNVNVTATWGGIALSLPIPEPPKPLFEISASGTAPDQDGSGATIQATWSDDVYTEWEVTYTDANGANIPGAKNDSSNDTSLDLSDSQINFPANTSAIDRVIIVKVSAEATNAYSNSGSTVSTEFEWVQPGVEPMPMPDTFDTIDLVISDEVTGASLSRSSISGISAGQFLQFVMYLSTEDGYETPATTEEANALISFMSNGFLDFATITTFRYYNVIIFHIDVNDDAVFTQDSYDLMVSGEYEQEASIDRCVVRGVQGNVTNSVITVTQNTYSIGDDPKPFFTAIPANGYEFTDATNVSVSGLTLTSPIHDDFPRPVFQSGNPSSIDIRLEDNGSISVYIQPKADGTFNEEEYTVTVNVTSTEIAPEHIDSVSLIDDDPSKTLIAEDENFGVTLNIDAEPTPVDAFVEFKFVSGPHQFFGLPGLSSDMRTLLYKVSDTSLKTLNIPNIVNNNVGSSSSSNIQVRAWVIDADGIRTDAPETVTKTFLGTGVMDEDMMDPETEMIGLTSLDISSSTDSFDVSSPETIVLTVTPNSDLDVTTTATLTVTGSTSHTQQVSINGTGSTVITPMFAVDPTAGTLTATITGTSLTGETISDSVTITVTDNEHKLITSYFAAPVNYSSLSVNPMYEVNTIHTTNTQKSASLSEGETTTGVYTVNRLQGPPFTSPNEFIVGVDGSIGHTANVRIIDGDTAEIDFTVPELTTTRTLAIDHISTPVVHYTAKTSSVQSSQTELNYSVDSFDLRKGGSQQITISKEGGYTSVDEIKVVILGSSSSDTEVTFALSGNDVIATVVNNIDNMLLADVTLLFSDVGSFNHSVNNIEMHQWILDADPGRVGISASLSLDDAGHSIVDTLFSSSQTVIGRIYWKEGNSLTIGSADGSHDMTRDNISSLFLNRYSEGNIGEFIPGKTYTFGFIVIGEFETTALSETTTIHMNPEISSIPSVSLVGDNYIISEGVFSCASSTIPFLAGAGIYFPETSSVGVVYGQGNMTASQLIASGTHVAGAIKGSTGSYHIIKVPSLLVGTEYTFMFYLDFGPGNRYYGGIESQSDPLFKTFTETTLNQRQSLRLDSSEGFRYLFFNSPENSGYQTSATSALADSLQCEISTDTERYDVDSVRVSYIILEDTLNKDAPEGATVEFFIN